VQDEVLVGKIPLQVDILLVRREGGVLSEAGRHEVSALVTLLNRFTLIKFKGPTDSLERGDFAQPAGCTFFGIASRASRFPATMSRSWSSRRWLLAHFAKNCSCWAAKSRAADFRPRLPAAGILFST
jgi:hypothetical protein